MAPPAPSATPNAPKNYAADIVSRMGSNSPVAENKFVDASAMRGFSDLYGPSSGKRMASWPKKNSDRYIVTDDDPNKAKILVHRPKPKKTGNNFNDYFVAVPLSSLKNGAFYVDGMPTSPVVKGREKTDGLSAWAASNANSATFGQADKIAGAINATVEQIANRYSSRSPGAPASSWGEAYEKFQGRAREQIAQARQDEPGWSAVGDGTGFIGPGVVVGGATAKLAAPVVNTITRMGGAPANMLSKVVSGGLQGATAGGLYGYTVGAENEALDRGEASPELFAPERAQSAQTNAVIGSAFGGAMPLLEPFVRPAINALSNVGSKLLNPIAPGIAEANTRRIATDAARRSLERSGIITVDDFLKRAAKYGDKPVMTGELGQNTLSNLVSLTRQPGTTAEKATAILEGRVAGMPGRLLKDIADETGLNPDDVYASLEDMVKTSRAKAAPLYEEAEAAPFAETANLERIVRDAPILRSLYSKAVNRVKNQAVPLIGQADQMPPLKVYDELKQLVDEEISKRLANGQGISDIEGVRQTLLRELDLISAQGATGVENPSLTQSLYATAREAGGEAPRIEKGLQAGERALQNRGVADDIEREVSKLTGQELSAYQIGVLRNIVKTVESGKLTPSRINSPDFQKRLRSVFGNAAADGIIKKFGIEAKLSQTGARINPNINSVTAVALNAGPSKTGDALMQMGQSAARGNIKDTAIGAVSAMVNFLRRQGYSEKQLDAIGDILTSAPDDAAKILFPGKTPRPGSIPPTVPPAGSVRENPRTPQLAPPVASVPQNPLNVQAPPTPQGPPTNALAPRRPEQAGFGGKSLPMDEPSRMQRAREQGFDVDTPLYHGTASDFEAFDRSKFGSATDARSAKLGVWLTSSPDTAAGYAKLASEDTPVSKILKLAEEAERKGNWDEYAALTRAAEAKERDIAKNGGRGANVMPLYVRGKIKSVDMDGAKYDPSDTPLSEMAAQAKAEGYDGLRLQNFSDEGGWGRYSPTDHVLIFDPKNIRGKFAKFDPAESGSSKLLAGMGGVMGLGVLSAGATLQRDETPKPKN
jgi:hypothetical protein